MSERLHVSVVMPSYNQAGFIKEAIDSILEQNYNAINLLVMDGGSTDGTVDILASYGDRITFVSQRDRGQSDAINQGLRRVEGDIVCWLNSDDLFTPNAILNVVRAFDNHPDVDFIYGKGWNIDANGALLGDSNVLPFNLWRLIHQRNFIQQPSCFFKKSLLNKVGPVNESLHYVMDWELWIRFSAYKGLFIDEYLSSNRTYDDNKTQSGQFRRWREIRAMISQYTHVAWPPVLGLYFLEALIQAARYRSVPHKLAGALHRAFVWGMMKELSGVYFDGGIAPHFYFSAGNPLAKSQLRLSLTPLSRYDRSRLGFQPVAINWKSSGGQRGQIMLLENGHTQEFTLPLDQSNPDLFAHFYCQADASVYSITAGGTLPSRCIIGFLDRIDV
jgi:glycosyltransferase involved in cell wall biosynthesis